MTVADLGVIEILIRILGAALLGSVMGFEREVDGKEASLRTHVLLATGAAMFGVISVSGFGDVRTGADLPVSIDPSRVAASVAAGVGFLGAGAILKLGVSVTGLTTAASLWVTAAVGLASGL